MERRFTHTLELRTDSQGDEMAISGYAATWNSLSEPLGGRGGAFRERLCPGCFQRSLQSDRDVKALFNHDSSLILGRKKNGTLSVNEDAHGLRFRAILPDTSTARDCYNLIKRGDISDCSFAFDCDEDQWSEVDDPSDPDTRTALRTIVHAKLYDVSVVAAPAYPGTSVNARGLNPSPLDIFPEGIPESFPREVRSRILTSGFSRNDSRRRVLDFILN